MSQSTVLLTTPAGLEEGDLPLILEVLLVADEEDEYGGAGQRPRVRQPVRQAVEGFPRAHVIHEQRAWYIKTYIHY
jgi:hypothetical protein